jgi:hypothetical protein
VLPGLLSAQLGVTEAMRCVWLLCGLAAHAPQIPADTRAAWLALLHYGGSEGAWVSEVTDPAFFLDAEGPRNPEREWRAALGAFLLPVEAGHGGQHAQCRFPARFALMRQALGWSDADVPRVDCPEYAAHERSLSARSVAVVFASYYLDNPASAFGHAMLYLGSGSERSAALADYAVTFEADVEGMSPLSYLPRGLFGGLIAAYRWAPLHERVRKYERQEQRDLWLFPLQVRQDEIDQLVRHLWELKDVRFKYGFFGGNCAQKLLAVLHAVAPTYAVLPYRSAAVLPSEVARRLVQQIGLAGEPMRRPSQQNQYASFVAQLTPREQQQLRAMIASRTIVDDASAATLSAALLWSEFETPNRAFRREAETESHGDFLWKRALWTSRVTSDDSSDAARSRPLQPAGASLLDAHRPSRITLGGGFQRGRGSVLRAGARWLLHGAVDPHVGYPPVASIEVANVELAVSGAGNVWVDEVTAVRVERLGPASAVQSSLAWKIDIGARRVAYHRESPLHLGAEVGIGRGAALLRPGYSVALFAMVGARPGVALTSDGAQFHPAGISSGGVLVRFPGDLRARVSAEYSLSLSSFKNGVAGVNAVARKGLTRGWDLELAATLGPNRSGVTLGFVSFH